MSRSIAIGFCMLALALVAATMPASAALADDVENFNSRDGTAPQGQRVLTLFPGKDFGHEIEIPAATAAFHRDAVLAGMLLQ